MPVNNKTDMTKKTKEINRGGNGTSSWKEFTQITEV